MVTFKPLEESDYQLLLDWLQAPHIKKWWDDGDDTIEKVTKHYSSDPDTTFRFIIQNSNQQFGYIQYYLLPENAVGVDLFVAETEYLNQGFGTDAVVSFIDKLVTEHNPSKIVIDPAPENGRAIRCFEKSGFMFDRIGLGADNKPAYFMVMERDA